MSCWKTAVREYALAQHIERVPPQHRGRYVDRVSRKAIMLADTWGLLVKIGRAHYPITNPAATLKKAVAVDPGAIMGVLRYIAYHERYKRAAVLDHGQWIRIKALANG